jgi:AcrR family transcriptional regulator
LQTFLLCSAPSRAQGFDVKAVYMGSDESRWRRPRSYHHGNLKEVLLEAARRLIEQHGPVGFSLTEAARLAGVSPAAPYRHFRDRDALLAEVARNGFERFAAKLDMAWNNGIPTPLNHGEDAGLKATADRAFDVLQRASAALCQALPPDQRPPVRLMSLHIWALSHGVADLFVQGRTGAPKIPLTPEEILESGMLIYLRGLGIVPQDKSIGAP